MIFLALAGLLSSEFRDAEGSLTHTQGFSTLESPVILRTQARQPRRKLQPRQTKNTLINTYWDIFKPPGQYTLEFGLAAGTNFLNTAYGGINPNVFLRAHGAYKIDPTLPFTIHAALDGNIYEQSAGDLKYSSNFLMLAAGGGLQYWYYGMRLDVQLEAGVLARYASQTDGFIKPVETFSASLAAGAWTGMAFSLGGNVALSFKLGTRVHSLQSLDVQDGRVDYMVVGGLEFMPDAQTYDPY